jgi:hypothetical protein
MMKRRIRTGSPAANLEYFESDVEQIGSTASLAIQNTRMPNEIISGEICWRENAKCFCAVQIGFYGFMLVSNTSIFAVGKDRERFNDFQMSLHCFFY